MSCMSPLPPLMVMGWYNMDGLLIIQIFEADFPAAGSPLSPWPLPRSTDQSNYNNSENISKKGE